MEKTKKMEGKVQFVCRVDPATAKVLLDISYLNDDSLGKAVEFLVDYYLKAEGLLDGR